MKSFGIALVLALALGGCSKSKDSGTPAGSGSATPTTTTPVTGSGSAAAGSGSATTPAAGSGSGSGSAATPAAGSGSGSATADAGSGAGSGSGSGSGAGSAGSAGSPDFDFDKLTYDEKRAFMKDHVVPTMKPLFQKFDDKKFANFGCKTCHGKDPQKTKYKMPSADLPKLDFAALEAGKQKPETAKWMADVVKPQMAKLVNQPEMSKSNPDGFGCLECHHEKKK